MAISASCDGVHAVRGDEDAAHGGALLAGLLGHLAHHVLEEQAEGGGAVLDVGAEDGGVQAVGLDVHPRVGGEEVGPRAEAARGVRRAGEGEDVVRPQPVEQVAGRADDELQGALGEEAGLDDQLDRPLGHHRGRGGGLGDHRRAGEQGAGRLFGEPPDGEVEGVDVDGDAVAGDQDVPAVEPLGLGELDALTLGEEGAVAEPLAEGEVVGEGAGAAVDVERAVRLGGAGVAGGEVEQLVAVVAQHLRHLLEEHRPLAEGHRPQGRAALLAGVVEHRPEIDPGAAGLGDRLLGRGVHQRHEARFGLMPVSTDIAPQRFHRSPSRVGARAAGIYNRVPIASKTDPITPSHSPCQGEPDAP